MSTTTTATTQTREAPIHELKLNATKRGFVKMPSDTSVDELISIIERDGGVIVKNYITPELAQQLRTDLKPYFDKDPVDPTGFFPSTTQRASGLLGISDACVELATNPIYLAVANKMLSETFSYWNGPEMKTCVSKPQISSTVGFRVNPGGRQQVLHRDDSDNMAKPRDWPIMLGSVTAVTKTTAANGATVAIPGSHKWEITQRPSNEDAVPAELEIGETFIFLGNLLHAGGGNITKDEIRETIGIFLVKGYLRQAENQYLMVPPELAKKRNLSPQVLRLLGYGISEPGCGFVDYKDPMESVFGIIDEETSMR